MSHSLSSPNPRYTSIAFIADELRKRGFITHICSKAKDAVPVILKEAEDATTIGFGGSETIKALGIREKLAAAGKTILYHGNPSLSPEEKMEIMRRQLTADLFLLSANALTVDGRLVNIDGNGNRVAASIFGPKKVIFVVGHNKIVPDSIDKAIARIKRKSAPPNCRRLNKNTPCATTGKCTDCHSPDRICKVTVILDECPRQTNIHVVLVDEKLGF